MRNEPDIEAPLEQQEVVRILRVCCPDALLVGGQALAFWADHLEVARPAELADGVTADADFIGDATLARRLGRQLGWRTWVPSLDEATPQTGKVTHRLKNGTVKQVDFLSGVAGLTTKDLVRRAAELEVPGLGRLRVIHPLDVLDSRIQNLHLLPQKRTNAGIAQARLSVAMAREYISREIAQRGERAGMKLLERVAEIAADIAAVQVFLLYGVDPLDAVPIEQFRTTTALHKVRWPQILTAIDRKRSARRRLASSARGGVR
jgi:hypothetical protein